MNRATRIVVSAVAVAAAISFVASVAAWHEQGLGRLTLLVPMTLLLGVSSAFPLRYYRLDRVETASTESIFMIAGLLLFEPLGALLMMVVGLTLGCVWSSRAVAKLVFNAGNATLSTAAALYCFTALRGEGGVGARAMVVAALSCVVFSLVARLLLCLVIRASTGAPFPDLFFDGTRQLLFHLGADVSVGLLAAVATTARPWAPVLVVLPFGLLAVALSAQVRARLDRERVEGLLAATDDIHASVDVDAIADALTRHARLLLRCGTARCSATPPADGEWGALIPVSGVQDLWLVVSDHAGLDPFGPAEEYLLEALAMIAKTALENGALVTQIRHQATHDPLTGLPNQLLLDDRIRQAVQRDRAAAVLVIAVDDLARVNETLGHSQGGALLVEVGRRLCETVRSVDTVASISGSQFAAVLPGLTAGNALTAFVERLLREMRRPFVVEGQPLHITVSIGVAVHPDDGNDAAVLLRNAEAAMHRAVESGGNTLRHYDAGMNEAAQLRLARKNELHLALERGELTVLYQPQIDLTTGRVVGAEALVRWLHPEHGLLPPMEFVPLAEESDLIVELDLWVLRQACLQALAWDAAGLPALRIATNFSGRHFTDPRVVSRLRGLIDATGIDAGRIELEITESLALREAEGTLDVLRDVHALGVSLAIDDFGTGYSALAQIERFPVDRLKIDRSFVNRISDRACNAPLVSAFLGIARALDLDVTAEGVETLEQQAFLRAHGCQEAQGYLYSRPVPPEEIEAMVQGPTLGLRLREVGQPVG